MSANTTEEKKINLFGLIGMVISACIGSGVFALTGQLANVASPGASLIAWLLAGTGFTALALSLKYLSERRPDIPGLFAYSQEGFGPLAGFLSGWGYWFSAWLGSVAFATIMMQALGYYIPAFLGGNTIPAIIVASILNWFFVILVIRGVEEASIINAIIMCFKLGAVGTFIVFCIVLFDAEVFTTDFWGTMAANATAMASTPLDLGSIPEQVINCLVIVTWVFVGIEGASVMSARAKNKKDVGKATLIGICCLLIVYVGASILPYGYMPYTEVAQLQFPAMMYVFDSMLPGFGGAFIGLTILLSAGGAWLSFTILPAQTTSEMANAKLLPSKWGELNSKNAPQWSLLVIGSCIQVMLLTLIFTDDAYNFAYSMSTMAIMFPWALAAAYQVKLAFSLNEKRHSIMGIVACTFLGICALMSGWQYLLIVCIGFATGFYFYWQAWVEQGQSINKQEKIILACFVLAAVASVVLLAMGVIAI